jgi:methyl-accepting chemotaxis protein
MIGGALCSLLGVFGVLVPFSIGGAAVLCCLALALVIWDQRSRGSSSEGEVHRGGVGRVGSFYESAVMFLYQGRVSRRRGLNLIDRTVSLEAGCRRLKAWIRKSGQTSGAVSDPSGAGSSRHEVVVDGGGHTTAGGVGSIMEEVIASVREMSGVLRDVDHNAKELITSTEETAYSMTRLDSFLQDMANSGRELEASTDTANRVALEGTKVVEEMGKENEAIISTVNEAASAVEDLGRWSQEVGKIVEVIRDIANETNLLALNASIIAAQSGEHGKAFGVVAEEIRGLAERTSSSTKEISDLVKAVQKNVANVVNGMKKSLQRVERGELLTRNAGTVLEKVFESFESSRNLAKQIASSTFEHKIDSSQVVRSLQKVSDIARRLQSHNYAGWTGAGETLGVARALSTFCDHGNGVKQELPSLGFGGGDRNGPGLSWPADSDKADLSNLLTEFDQAIACCLGSLEDTRNTLDSWLGALDRISQAVTVGFDTTIGGTGTQDLTPCWDITRCEGYLKEKCPVYGTEDRSLFFSPKAACVLHPVEEGERDGCGGAGSAADAGRTDKVTHKVGS